jgi:hypothetical protein
MISGLMPSVFGEDGGNKPLYDETGNGKAQITAAVAQAQKEGKNVLIMWGGNTCRWCHVLHALFESNEKINTVLKSNYVSISVDAQSNMDLMKEMKIKNRRTTPFLTVLDPKGQKVRDENPESMENGNGHDPELVLAFLKKYSVESTRNDSRKDSKRPRRGGSKYR